MSRLFKKDNKNLPDSDKRERRHNTIIGLLLVLSIVLIAAALYFSREGGRTYSYEVGKPWLHARLDADFEFDIQPDRATLKHIQDSVENNFAKIYTLDRKKGEQQNILLQRALAGKPGAAAIIEAHAMLYNDGIVENNCADDIRAGKKLRFIVGNNELQEQDTYRMRTVRQAYTWLMDSLTQNATILATLRDVNVQNYLEPNMKLDEEENQKWLGQEMHNALRSPGTVQANEAIITRGEIVTPTKAAAIESYMNEINERAKEQRQDRLLSLAGQVLIVTILMLAFFFFMKLQRNQVYRNLRQMVFLISFITFFCIAVFMLVKFKYNMLYIIPFGLVPIIVSSFFDDHTSFFVHIVTVLICSLIAIGSQAEFIIMQFLAGIIAIVSVKELLKRFQIVRCAALIFLAYSLTYIAMTLFTESDYDNIDSYYLFYFGINCIILSFAFLVIPIVERLFGFTSSMTLMELTDTNNALLRQLSTLCPGTLQHSIQVANLGGEAALKIGANMHMVRAGALYHDIGKIGDPAFFTENQLAQANPHDTLDPYHSAKIVIKHVTYGKELAEKHNLPKVIIDMIMQHHGKGLTSYFYQKALAASNGAEVDKAAFSYPGPNPQTKEAAILMMADACEAATKSLSDHSAESISNMVNNIIDNQVNSGLLKESPISFKDINVVKDLLIKRLRTIYHARVAYPGDPKTTKKTPAEPAPEATTPPPYNGSTGSETK